MISSESLSIVFVIGQLIWPQTSLILGDDTHASKFIVLPVLEMLLFLLLHICFVKSGKADLKQRTDCLEVCWDSTDQEIVPDACCSNHYCACQNHNNNKNKKKIGERYTQTQPFKLKKLAFRLFAKNENILPIGLFTLLNKSESESLQSDVIVTSQV